MSALKWDVVGGDGGREARRQGGRTVVQSWPLPLFPSPRVEHKASSNTIFRHNCSQTRTAAKYETCLGRIPGPAGHRKRWDASARSQGGGVSGRRR